jgi:hypothetical protein
MDKRFSQIKYFLFSIIFLPTFYLSASGDSIDTFIDRQIIRAADIEKAGIHRIGDIFLLINPCFINTTDGFSWQPSIGGLSSFQNQNWIIMLNGRKFNLTSINTKNINMLPVTLSQIDSIEIIATPQFHYTEFVDNGLIHIHTRKPEPGISLSGLASMGNETKDPGPYRYTEFATPNIDKIGRDVVGNLSWGKDNYNLDIGLIYQQHIFTDLRIRNRVNDISSDWPNMNMISSYFNFLKKRNRTEINLFASYIQAVNYYLFFKPLGREVPVDNCIMHSGIKTESEISNNSNLNCTLEYEINHPGEHKNNKNIDFSWQMHNLYAAIENTFKKNNLLMKFGIADEFYYLNTRYEMDKNGYDIIKFYNSNLFSISHLTSQKIDVSLAAENGNVVLKSALSTTYKWNPRNELNLCLSYSQRLFEEDNSLWYWTQQGYNLLSDIGVDYDIIDTFEKSTQSTLDITWYTLSVSDLVINASGFYRYFEDLYFEKQCFQYNDENCSFFSPVKIFCDQGGQVAGFDILIRNKILSTLHYKFYYRYQSVNSGSDLFKETWKCIPEHKLSFQLFYTPVQNFSIWAMLNYFSSTEWAEYQDIGEAKCIIDNQINVEYSSGVQNRAAVDLHIQKWFWHRKIAGSLTLRNLLAKEYIYHPIGVGLDLSFYVKISVFI